MGREIERLFGDGDGMLVVTVAGGEEGAAETYRELMASLAYHHGAGTELGDIMVDVPDKDTLAKSLRVLSQPALQRAIMDQLLTAFGKRLIEPLRKLLDPGPQGALMAELVRMRGGLIQHVAKLQITEETRMLLGADIEKLLSDEYLDMLAENEEKVQQPRVQALAQEILHLLGNIFYRALQRWPGHADQIALMVTRRLDGKVRLRNLPTLMREQVIAGVEEFFWVETSSELEGALGPLFASHRDIAAPPPSLDRAPYRELAEGCWALVAREG